MKKEFKLTALVTISINTIVEAETLEEAIEGATPRDIQPYFHSDDEQEKVCWIHDEYDGAPREITER